MTDALGVDIDSNHSPARFKITGPLPAHVVQNAAKFRAKQERADLNQHEEHRCPEGSQRVPSVPDLEGAHVVACILGAIAGVVVGFVAAAITGAFGAAEAGIFAAVLVGIAYLMRRNRILERDAAVVADNHLEFDDPNDRSQMADAHQQALTVLKVWPGLPLPDVHVHEGLHQALWDLAKIVPPRREAHTALSELKRASFGVPAYHLSAQRLSEQLKLVEPRRLRHDRKIDRQLEKFRALAVECMIFDQELKGIERAELAMTSCDMKLGSVAASIAPQPDKDAEQLTKRVSEILSLYSDLTGWVASSDLVRDTVDRLNGGV